MKRPHRIKIGMHWYRILWIHADRPGGGIGMCDAEAKKLFIFTMLPKRMVAETLLHEMMHAIYYEWGIKNSQLTDEAYGAGLASEETAVNGLAAGISVVFQQNPKVFAYYRALLK